MTALLLLIAGGLLLIKGADWLVDGGAGIALKSGISPLTVGLTVVAFGTSAPELAASLAAALNGSGDICFGNVVGSNVANISLILGLTALLNPLPVNRILLRWELPFLIAITLFAWYIGITGAVNRLLGLVLLGFFAWYLHHCGRSVAADMEVDERAARRSTVLLTTLVIAGIAGLGFGGMLFVDGARTIARLLGMSEAVIGLTVVALGTSLPELITSVAAAIKGHADISIGNIVGSNIFNILLVLGTTAVIHPFAITPDRFLALVGMPVMALLAILLVPAVLTGSRISRAEGALFSIIYVLYIALAVYFS